MLLYISIINIIDVLVKIEIIKLINKIKERIKFERMIMINIV